MTKDEMVALRDRVWQKYTMQDILLRYGIRADSKGKCICPFHKDSHPSMYVKDRFYNCFVCKAGGDIFKFVQNMDGISFRDALFQLGDAREKMSFSEIVRSKQKQLERESIKQHEENLKYKYKENLLLISAYRNLIKKSEPLSDEWSFYQNKLMYQIYLLETR